MNRLNGIYCLDQLFLCLPFSSWLSNFCSPDCFFQAKIGRHLIGDREWEVYRVLIDEGDGLSVPRNKIEEQVWKMLMGWE